MRNNLLSGRERETMNPIMMALSKTIIIIIFSMFFYYLNCIHNYQCQWSIGHIAIKLLICCNNFGCMTSTRHSVIEITCLQSFRDKTSPVRGTKQSNTFFTILWSLQYMFEFNGIKPCY